MAIGADRVQVLKRETAALGGDAADERPYDAPIEPQEDALECSGVFLQDASNRDESTFIARDGAELQLQDVDNGSAPRTLLELARSVPPNAFTEPTRNADGTIASVTAWESASKTRILCDATVSRDGDGLISQVVETYRDEAGAVRFTVTHTIARGTNKTITNVESARS